MSQQSRATGQKGEQIAQTVLKGKGFEIVAANWRPHGLASKQTAGEIDIVAYHPKQQLLTFVEVKARKSSSYGLPAEAVGHRKQERLQVLAEHFLAEYSLPGQASVRFDVICVFYPGRGRPAEIEHLEDAFGHA